MSVLGSCGSGKNRIIKYIMAESKYVFDYVLVFTSTGFRDSYKYLNKLGIKNKILSSLNIDESVEKIMDKHNICKKLLL